MPRSRKTTPIVEGAEIVAAVLAQFDYAIDPDDFVFYGLAGLIDEDRASFDNDEFRRLIDEGVREHIQENPAMRAQLSSLLRRQLPTMEANARLVAERVIHAMEDLDSDLRNVGVLVRAYVSYLVARLQTIDDNSVQQQEALRWLERWNAGEILREDLVARLKAIGTGALAPAADLLFEAVDDRMAAEAAIEIIAGIRSPVSARILAHTVSEPMLPEDLEAKAFAALKMTWPLPRFYMLYNLHTHSHEDLPVAWFQLFVEVDELSTVDQALEELRVHGGDPDYQQDLAALLDVLQLCRDPELENKILGALNSPETDPLVLPLLHTFVREYQRPATQPHAWTRHLQNLKHNRRYIAAAKLFDTGRQAEAAVLLDEILNEDPEHPFAQMLKNHGQLP